MGLILSFTPLDLIDLFLNFKGFEIVKLGLVGLEFGVEFVLAALFLWIGNDSGCRERERSDWMSKTYSKHARARKRAEGYRPSHYVQTARRDHPCHLWRDSFRWNQTPR